MIRQGGDRIFDLILMDFLVTKFKRLFKPVIDLPEGV